MTPFHAPVVDWRVVAPELALAIGACVTLLLDALRPRTSRRTLAVMTFLTLGASGWYTLNLRHVRKVAFQGMVAVDGVALFARLILLTAAALTVLVSFHYLSRRNLHRGEFYPLLLLATAGMNLLVSANDLIMIFISLEVLSLALYVMVGFARKRRKLGREAALKYFLLGSFSSAFLLYGTALTYGGTGSTNLVTIAHRVATGGVDTRLMFAAIALIGAGFAFKIAAVPFHMWTPDTYQGAPTNVTGFMAAATKTAGFVAMVRVFLVAFGALQWDWRPVFWILAVATMILGSVIALAQTDVKRMLAYSSIAHAGYLLIGLVAGTRSGVSSMLFYLLVYALTVLGAFAAVIASAPGDGERLIIAQWSGIGRRHPAFGAAMTLFLLSLAGVPPTAGFMAKFLIFTSALQSHENALVVIAALTTVVAAFFYLRLIVLMWLQDPAVADMRGIDSSPALTVSLAIAAGSVLAFGVWPQALITLARRASVFTG